jgi:hypothetical protein
VFNYIKRENSEKNVSSVLSGTAEAMVILRSSMRAGKLCFYVEANLTHKAVNKIRETYVKIWLYFGVCMTHSL